VISPKALQGETLVLACDKAWLRQALAPLAESGWVIQRIVPELCPAETGDVSFHALESVDEPQLVACLADAVLGFARAAWPAGTRHWQAGSRLLAEPAAMTFARELTGQEAQLQTAPQRWLQACQSPWDLAQGEWAQNRHRRTWRFGLQAWQQLRHAPAWRPARWALGLLLLANLVGLQIWAQQTRQHTAQLSDASRRILQQTFPAVQVVVDPLRQMQQGVNQLRQQSGASAPQDFDVLLSHLAPLLPNDVTPKALRYDGQTLTVQGVQLNQVAPQVLSKLNRQGYQLRVQGADWVLSWEARP
jgi:general secretion pathway protein L